MYIELLLMYVVYPVLLLYKMEICPTGIYNEGLISKIESDILKGMAACMVVFAHYTIWIKEDGAHLGILEPVTNLGVWGVGIFFFLSGYGLTKSTKFKKQKKDFLLKRFLNTYVPYLVVRFVFSFLLDSGYVGVGHRIGFYLGIYGAEWFCVVIMILYIGYYLTSKIERYKLATIYIYTMVISSILFVFIGKEASYWYQGNIVFPLGITYAIYQNQIDKFIRNHYTSSILVSVIGFGVTCILEMTTKDIISILSRSLTDIFICMIGVVLLQKIKLNSNLFRHLGKYSLYIYIIHLTIYRIYNEYGIKLVGVWSIAYFVLSLGLSLMFKQIVDILVRCVNRKVIIEKT